ncbi:MAG: proline racemase family protein, partial [Ilumatobacteraceae bacterium]
MTSVHDEPVEVVAPVGRQITGPITTIDYHTAGEPFRIVTGGVEPPAGATMLDRRATAIAELDHVRAFIVNEPRGHADMYGCFVTPPDDDGAAFGLVFFHKDGFATACGHGMIAGVTWALHSGLVPAVAPLTTL